MGCGMNVSSSLEAVWGDATYYCEECSPKDNRLRKQSRNKTAWIKSETTPLHLPNPNLRAKQTCIEPFLRCERR